VVPPCLVVLKHWYVFSLGTFLVPYTKLGLEHTHNGEEENKEDFSINPYINVTLYHKHNFVVYFYIYEHIVERLEKLRREKGIIPQDRGRNHMRLVCLIGQGISRIS